MGRLTGQPSSDVQRNRLTLAIKLATEHNVVVVLKGARTVIAAPSGECWLNPTGHPGLATAGSGDVLAGILGALLARGLPADIAARIGVYVHGATADHLLISKGMSGLIASDLLHHIPTILSSWDHISTWR